MSKDFNQFEIPTPESTQYVTEEQVRAIINDTLRFVTEETKNSGGEIGWKVISDEVISKVLTLSVKDGTGDSKIQAGKTDFTNTENGFILGIDDSDSNKVKFFLGNDTNYINWDGSTLTIVGGIDISSKLDKTGGAYQSAASGSRVLIFPDLNTGIQIIDDSGNDVFKVLVGGTDVGDIVMGNFASDKGLKWDKSAGTFTVKGSLVTGASSIIDGQYLTDLTVTGSKLANLTITAAQIANATITGTQIASATITSDNIQNATITGTDIASATIAGSNIITGTITATQIANATITAGQIASATITGTQIAAATIAGSNIVSGTITATQIQDATITSGKIATGTITGGNIASGTIQSGNIASGTISAGNIANLTITAAQIANLTITASQIANQTVTNGQIAQNTITGGATGNLALLAVTADNIAANTITAAKIAAQTITASEIAAGTITSDKITVTSLSALSANMGTITAGTITLDASGHIKSGQTDYNTGNGFFLGHSTFNTGAITPSTFTNTAYGDGESWATPANAGASDDTYTTNGILSSNRSDYLDCTNLSSPVPTNATIVGIKVEVEIKSNVDTGAIDVTAQLIKTGTAQGSNLAAGTTITTTESYITYGGASSMWGLTLTPADVNASNFGFRWQGRPTGAGRTFSIDHVRITVYYTIPVFSIGNSDNFQTFNGTTLEATDMQIAFRLTSGEAITAGDAIQMGFYTGTLFIPSEDTYVREDEPNNNKGSEVILYAGANGGQRRYIFAKWDLTGLPTANLTSAILYFKTSNDIQGGTPVFYKITSSWAEGTVTWNTKPTVGASLGSVSTPNNNTFYSIDITTQVQNWLNGTDANYGVQISDAFLGMNSSEAATAADRPYLLLTYDNSKIFKSKADYSANTQRWVGFALETKAVDLSTKVQFTNIYTSSGLTPGSIYYLSDTSGAISTSAGTVSKKVGLALTATKLLILNT
ncbi:MAG: DNRLRE domain-containing protein [Patescibacteria group bacterium]|jgi:uncharacterized protein YjbI with pentapeptide repeats